MTEKALLILLLLASVIYLFFAQQLSFGSLKSPKSGFLPILAGITAVTLAVTLLYFHLRSKKIILPNTIDWIKFTFVIIGLLFYITFLTVLGYFASTFILLFYLFKIGDTSGWLLPFYMAISSSTVFYLIFKYYLAVPLP